MGRVARVLLTGAGGFIGRRVLRQLPAAWTVVALSRQPSEPRPGVLPLRWERATDALPAGLEEPFDVTIHLAGSADHGLAAREPWRDLEATGLTAAALFGRIRTRRLVLLSSAAVYAGHRGAVGPRSRLAPTMAYALSKLYVEGLVGALVAGGRVDDAVVLRLYNAYGPGERPTRLVPRVVAALEVGEPFVLTGDPTSLSDPLHVDDVAAALVAAASAPDSATDRVATLDLCGGDPRPLREQVGRIATALGREPPALELRPNPVEVPIHFWSSPDGARRRLGLGQFLALEDGVRRYAAEAGWPIGRGGSAGA